MLAKFIRRFLIDDDPHPRPSRLDYWDGRGTVELASADDDGFACTMAVLADIDGGSLHLVDAVAPTATVGVPR